MWISSWDSVLLWYRRCMSIWTSVSQEQGGQFHYNSGDPDPWNSKESRIEKHLFRPENWKQCECFRLSKLNLNVPPELTWHKWHWVPCSPSVYCPICLCIHVSIFHFTRAHSDHLHSLLSSRFPHHMVPPHHSLHTTGIPHPAIVPSQVKQESSHSDIGLNSS